MQVAIRRKIGASGGTPGLWMLDWDSIAALSPPTTTSSSAKDKQLHGEVQHVEKHGHDESNEAEEQDIETNSTMEGPQSPADMFSPSSISSPPIFSPQNQTPSSPPSQPRVSQPQGLDSCLTIGVSSCDDQDTRKEKSKEAEEEDFITNSILESPTTSAKRPPLISFLFPPSISRNSPPAITLSKSSGDHGKT